MLLQNLKIILHVAFFSLYNHFMEKQKIDKKNIILHYSLLSGLQN